MLNIILLLLHLTLLVLSQCSTIVYSKSGRDCLHGTLGLERIRRAQNDINVNVYFIYKELHCVWLHFFKIDTCGRMPESINDNSYFVGANGYGYPERIAAGLPDPTTTINTTAADLTTSVTTTLPTTTTSLTPPLPLPTSLLQLTTPPASTLPPPLL